MRAKIKSSDLNNDKEHGRHHDERNRQVKGMSGCLIGKKISFVFNHVEFEVLEELLVEVMFEKLKETGQDWSDWGEAVGCRGPKTQALEFFHQIPPCPDPGQAALTCLQAPVSSSAKW